MLAALLCNLGARQVARATFTSGARLTFRLTAPLVSPYYSHEWAAPQGSASNAQVQFKPHQGATAKVARARPVSRAAAPIRARGAWSARVVVTAQPSRLQARPAGVAAGQTAQVKGAKARVVGNPPRVQASWAAAASVSGARVTAARARARARAGATARFAEADFVAFSNGPATARGVRNPSPAEIIAMVHASGVRL